MEGDDSTRKGKLGGELAFSDESECGFLCSRCPRKIKVEVSMRSGKCVWNSGEKSVMLY